MTITFTYFTAVVIALSVGAANCFFATAFLVHEMRSALGTKFARRNVPTDKVTFGVPRAAVKHRSLFGNTLYHILSAFGANSHLFRERFGVFAVGIVGAGKILAVFSLSFQHFCPAKFANYVRFLGGCFFFQTFDVGAFGVVGTGKILAVSARFDYHGCAALVAGNV